MSAYEVFAEDFKKETGHAPYSKEVMLASASELQG